MSSLAAGTRLKSTVCNTEVMVISAPDEDVELMCGGAPMTNGEAGGNGGSVDPAHADGTQLGKRYVSEDGKLEILCVKPGDGSLAVGGTALKLKDAKKLPKTD
jgi:hypothetical protein